MLFFHARLMYFICRFHFHTAPLITFARGPHQWHPKHSNQYRPNVRCVDLQRWILRLRQFGQRSHLFFTRFHFLCIESFNSRNLNLIRMVLFPPRRIHIVVAGFSRSDQCTARRSIQHNRKMQEFAVFYYGFRIARMFRSSPMAAG